MELCLLFNTFIIPSTRQTVPFHIIKEVHFLHLASTLLRSWIAPRLLPQKHCILCLVPNGCCCLCTSSLMCSLSSCCNLAVIYINMCCTSLRFLPSFECTDALGIIYTVDFPMWDFRLFRVEAQWETETGAQKIAPAHNNSNNTSPTHDRTLCTKQGSIGYQFFMLI